MQAQSTDTPTVFAQSEHPERHPRQPQDRPLRHLAVIAAYPPGMPPFLRSPRRRAGRLLRLGGCRAALAQPPRMPAASPSPRFSRSGPTHLDLVRLDPVPPTRAAASTFGASLARTHDPGGADVGGANPRLRRRPTPTGSATASSAPLIGRSALPRSALSLVRLLRRRTPHPRRRDAATRGFRRDGEHHCSTDWPPPSTDMTPTRHPAGSRRPLVGQCHLDVSRGHPHRPRRPPWSPEADLAMLALFGRRTLT